MALSGVALPVLSVLLHAFAPFLAVGVLVSARLGAVPRLVRGLAPVAIGGHGFERRLCLIAVVPGRRGPRVRPDSLGVQFRFPSSLCPPSLHRCGHVAGSVCTLVGLFRMGGTEDQNTEQK